MADYKNPEAVKPLYLAFDTVLDLAPFEQQSEHAANEFHNRKQMNEARASGRSTLGDLIPVLLEDQLISLVDDIVDVTPEARRWAQVFRLRHDGMFLIFESRVDAKAWNLLGSALHSYHDALGYISVQVRQHLGDEHTTPTRVAQLRGAIADLLNLPSLSPSYPSVDLYKESAVLACREEIRRLQEHKEHLEVRARDRQVLDGVTQKIQHLEDILAIPCLAGALATPKPRVTDFVNIGVIEEFSHGRETDEKFGILSAPTLFSKDFAEAATGAFSRGRSFAVGFLDIDDFGKFNKAHDEVVVDRDMLPNFMRALEAYCYGRAYAYRQGGDEYLVILHNADQPEAESFFKGLQTYIATTPYPDTIQSKPTISIGVHVIDGDHEVTVFQAKKRANEAKNVAKKSNKNCVRFSTDPMTGPISDS